VRCEGEGCEDVRQQGWCAGERMAWTVKYCTVRELSQGPRSGRLGAVARTFAALFKKINRGGHS
jgi:hypothetical protein